MTDQPSRITLAELSALIDQLRQPSPDEPLDARIVYHQEKSWLLDDIAYAMKTPEGFRAAYAAWQQLVGQYAQRTRRVTP